MSAGLVFLMTSDLLSQSVPFNFRHTSHVQSSAAMLTPGSVLTTSCAEYVRSSLYLLRPWVPLLGLLRVTIGAYSAMLFALVSGEVVAMTGN